MKKIQVKHVDVKVGKQIAKSKLGQPILVPRLKRDIIDGRWTAISLHGTLTKLEPDVEKMVRAALEAIIATKNIVDQRDVYYSIRGSHPTWTYNNYPLKSEQAYNAFVGTVMEKVQLFTGVTMQSLGVRAGPRGYITGDGSIKTPKRGLIPLRAKPALDFDLVDVGVEVNTNARKVIHFEKSAGFEGLIAHDMPKMIEAIFSTSQGYLVESANKFLADCENRGMRLYCLHDADPHGIQMQLMYGMASKSNAYMPSEFYPREVTLLGLFPRVAKKLGLPAEDVGATHKRIAQNLLKLVKERPEMKVELNEILSTWKQWEFQALNGLGSSAPAIYMVEALRAVNDEIKYVPEARKIKEVIVKKIEDDVRSYIEEKIRDFAVDFLMSKILNEFEQNIKDYLRKDIDEMEEKAKIELQKLYEMSDDDLREAVKKKLVQRPTRYWTDAVRTVVNDILEQKFDLINEIIEYTIPTVKSLEVKKKIQIQKPDVPVKPLTKDDIVNAIEDRITKKMALRKKIRDAVESILGKPNSQW